MAVEDTSVPPSSDDFPDYSQMILSAVEALNEPDGSSKLAISNYLESNYPDLPSSHPTLLSNSLEKLVHSEQLYLHNGLYSTPKQAAESNGAAPAKRGRGRPPKRKGTELPAAVPGYPRPRGRPPKARDPLAPAPETKVSSGRPRGRPRKNPDEVVVPKKVVDGVKRGRGRPPKAKV